MNEENLISILGICEKSELNYFKYCVNGEELSFQRGSLSDNDSINFEYKGTANKERIDEEDLTLDNIDKKIPDEKSSESATLEFFVLKSNFVGIFTISDCLKEGKAPVKKGDVLGVIEAMKVYNDIIAPVDGIIEEILVANGSLVECDQGLISIRVNE